MGIARTLVVVLIPGLMSPAAPALASPDMTSVFAVCAGQLSALVEHDWLMSRDPSGAEAQYAAMLDVLDAVTVPEIEAEIMGWRVAAKVAMRRMLEHGDLGDDAAAREWAAALIGQCQRLIVAPGA